MGGLELRGDGADGYLVVAGDQPKGSVRIVGGDAGTTAVCLINEFLDLEESRQLVRRLDALGVNCIATGHPIVQLAARQAGFGGPLRSTLARGAELLEGDLAEQTEQLLPGSRVRLLPHRGFWRKLVADSTSGVWGMTRLGIEPPGSGPEIEVAVPERQDSLAEVIALAVDTARGIHARFGSAADYVRTISFDHAAHGMSTGKTGGAAPFIRGVIHLNASYSFVAGVEALERIAERHRAPDESLPAPGTVPFPWTAIDDLVAHEFWHKIEMAWEARRYKETIEFRREIGGWYGQPTLERVFVDPSARAALAEGVSAYAATNRLEATAEMFKLWWCGPSPPDSVPARFGELVDRYFPS